MANLKQLRPCMFGFCFGHVKFSRAPKINASSTDDDWVVGAGLAESGRVRGERESS